MLKRYVEGYFVNPCCNKLNIVIIPCLPEHTVTPSTSLACRVNDDTISQASHVFYSIYNSINFLFLTIKHDNTLNMSTLFSYLKFWLPSSLSISGVRLQPLPRMLAKAEVCNSPQIGIGSGAWKPSITIPFVRG